MRVDNTLSSLFSLQKRVRRRNMEHMRRGKRSFYEDVLQGSCLVPYLSGRCLEYLESFH